jgi:dihydrodipicolinate synthase/N-acetylneuraminate lyase
MSVNFLGVMPAITTKFNADLLIDHEFVREHVQWLVQHGATAIVPCGSLGEGATLSFDEKIALIKTCVAAVDVPVIPGIAATSTADAVQFAQAAHAAGARGLMVLPPYLYVSDWREMKTHMSAVISATPLPCILYNNPVAYKTDFLPEQIAELAAEHANLAAVKESSTDVRRISWIRALLGERLAIGVGVDDALLEGVAAGAQFWIAGLVNAFPAESVRLYDLARAGRHDEAFALYRWFLPLLRMDTVPKFVQLIKLVQAKVGMGSEIVRAPRLLLSGAERATAEAEIATALAILPMLQNLVGTE